MHIVGLILVAVVWVVVVGSVLIWREKMRDDE